MPAKTHQKKRNSGLLYEFLVRTISRALIDGDKRASSRALKVVRRHFKPGTELYKEFRLINSLVKTTVSSEAVAASIMQEAKAAARSHDERELDRQKSLLIRSINHTINDENFYDQQVDEYKTYATIQTLVNDWRSRDADLERLAKYEDQLLRWLVAEKAPPPDQQIADDSPGTSRLLMKVMMKKLNEKYAGVLSDEQRALVRAYAFSTANDDAGSIKYKLLEVRDQLVESISRFRSEHAGDEYVDKKVAAVLEQVTAEQLDSVDDDTVTRFMLYTKLRSELESGEE